MSWFAWVVVASVAFGLLAFVLSRLPPGRPPACDGCGREWRPRDENGCRRTCEACGRVEVLVAVPPPGLGIAADGDCHHVWVHEEAA